MIKEKLKPWIPEKTRRRLKHGLLSLGHATGPLRVLPDFLVVGVQKGGTSSLFYYLQNHPQICLATAITKEVHYFDDNYSRPLEWYRAHFPLTVAKHIRQSMSPAKLLTCEATPAYIFHPLVAERVRLTLPNAKFICVLRNPVDRAFSQYRMEVKRTREDRPFAKALQEERTRIEAAYHPDGSPRDAECFDREDFWYQRRGFYLEQVKRWHAALPKENLLIVRAEDLWARPEETWRKTLEFLQLEYAAPDAFERINEGQGSDLDPGVRDELTEYFRPMNLALSEYLGEDYTWQ